MAHTATELQTVADYIRAILNNNDPEKPDPAAIGEWGDVVDHLATILESEGLEAARQKCINLIEARKDLGAILALDGRANGRFGGKVRWTAAELMQTDFPEPIWAIPGVIPAGFSILAGRPKLGKSWLALQIAHSMATGGKTFGVNVTAARVLFYALEDSERRIKERLKKQGVPETDKLQFQFEIPQFQNGGMAELTHEIKTGGYGLIVIDTLSRAMGNIDNTDLAANTEYLGKIQSAALSCNVAVLAVDHHRKTSAEYSDPVDDIMGTTGKSAVADALLGLYRKRGKIGASLKVTGREIEEKELALEWDGALWCWQYVGLADEVRETELQAEIMKAIQEIETLGDLPTISRISSHIDKLPPSISRALANMVNNGKVIRGKKQGKEIPYKLAE